MTAPQTLSSDPRWTKALRSAQAAQARVCQLEQSGEGWTRDLYEAKDVFGRLYGLLSDLTRELDPKWAPFLAMNFENLEVTR